MLRSGCCANRFHDRDGVLRLARPLGVGRAGVRKLGQQVVVRLQLFGRDREVARCLLGEDTGPPGLDRAAEVPRLLVADDLDRGGAGTVELLPVLVTGWRTRRWWWWWW
jgi:hypothetical protein